MAHWLPWRKKRAGNPSLYPDTGERIHSSSSLDADQKRISDNTSQGVPEPSFDQSVKKALWRQGLARLRRAFLAPLDRLLHGRPFSEEIFAELEETLIGADIGVQTAASLISHLRERCRQERPTEAEILKTYLKEEMLTLLQKLSASPVSREAKPWVILMVGVNGVGKTTTIAKLAARFLQEKKKVLLVAADTFRAAATEQLEVWAERLGVDLIKHKSGTSPAAVAFDGMHAAVSRGADVVIVDTAGRLHTKTPLMEELKKVHRVIARELPGAPHEVLLVLDAATGQNALSQARTFQQAFPLSGVILAKMDGSARGGVALAVVEQLKVPIRYIGLGEQIADLQDFHAVDFVDAVFAPGDGEVSLDMEASDP